MPHPKHSPQMPGWNVTGASAAPASAAPAYGAPAHGARAYGARAYEALVILVCAGLLTTCMGVAAAAAADRKPPHVLVICADDHAAYVTSAEGNPLVRTPNIDRLARGGVRFTHAYCNSPVCTASRQSFFTGRYPRSIGVTRLETPLPDSEVTLAETLKLAGYDTAGIGKMHFNSELKHGFDLRLDQPEAHRAGRGERKPPARPKTATSTDTAAEPNAAAEPESAETFAVPVQPPWRPFKDPARVWLNAECRPVGLTDAQMEGTWYAEQAAEFLAKPHEKPFFLMVSFYEPHSPYRFPLEYAGRLDPAKFPLEVPGPEDDDQIPEIFRGLTPAEKQGIAAAYYTSVEYMDKNVGLVLDALDRSGLANDTIVIYLGDHGYHLGQHGRFEKHCSFEEAIRVPLAIRYPRTLAGERVSRAMVELVDLVPTIYELCGFRTTAPLQGQSLLPLLMAKTTKHRSHVIVEYAQNDEVMIRDAAWKLIYERNAQRRTDGYDTGRPLKPHQFRLYDLKADPHELHNVVADEANAATVERLTNLLVEHLTRTAREPELIPAGADAVTKLDFCVQSRDVPKPGKRD